MHPSSSTLLVYITLTFKGRDSLHFDFFFLSYVLFISRLLTMLHYHFMHHVARVFKLIFATWTHSKPSSRKCCAVSEAKKISITAYHRSAPSFISSSRPHNFLNVRDIVCKCRWFVGGRHLVTTIYYPAVCFTYARQGVAKCMTAAIHW